jgi:hypothetical protein
MKSIVHGDPHPKGRDNAAGGLAFLAALALVVFLAYQLVDLSGRMIGHSASLTAVVHDATRLTPLSK